MRIYSLTLIEEVETLREGKTQLPFLFCKKTRMKTSIRYAKENDREKRQRRRERERKKGRRRYIERKKGRRRYIEREGEMKERER